MSSTPKKYDFSGKVALVTGSSSGIGAAIAIQLAQYGAKVTITGRSAEKLEKVAQEIIKISGGHQPLQILGDLLDDSLPEKLIQETVGKFGRLDILVNNAGLSTVKGTLASPVLLQEWDTIMKVNVRSVVDLTQRAVAHLEATKGNVINISSVAGIIPNHFPMLVYCASKAALDMITKTSALELGPKGIRVNCISPGPVFTDIGRSLGNENIYYEKKSDWTAKTVLKRIAEPEEMAHLASFLASDDAKNITGSILVNDGGMLLC